jgi:hypothetical protein
MTKEETLALAKQAGLIPEWANPMGIPGIDEFARLIRNAALEEAAVKCDALSDDLYEESVRRNVQDDLIAKQCAAAIRSLKEEA